MPKYYGSLHELSRGIDWCLLLRTSANHEHELRMGSNQVVELRDEYSSNIQSKIFYNVGLDLLVVEGGQTMI
jgi:hypothetical protein